MMITYVNVVAVTELAVRTRNQEQEERDDEDFFLRAHNFTTKIFGNEDKRATTQCPTSINNRTKWQPKDSQPLSSTSIALSSLR